MNVKKVKLRMKKIDINRSKKWLYDEYIIKMKSSYLIASELGIGRQPVYRKIKEYGFKKEKVISEQQRKDISNTLKKKYKLGLLHKTLSVPPSKKTLEAAHKANKGRKQTKAQIDKRRFKIIGKKHPNYKYGHYCNQINKTMEWKKWREYIFNRDNYTCQECGKKGCYIEPHHILKMSKYPKLKFKKSNGITLCKDCHNNTKCKETFFVDKYTNIIKGWSKGEC